jgi:hypothetical protein
VSKVSKIEHGVRPASGDDVRTWCQVCGATAERTEELLAEQRAVAGMWVPYQQLNRAGLRKAQESVRPSYDNSALVRSYQPKIVPGLLQTAAYTTALLEDARDKQRVQRDDVAEAVAERVSRQKMLTRAGHQFVFVIEEPVLRYRFCEPEIQRGQLLHLRDATRLPAVWLGIIPLGGDRRSPWRASSRPRPGGCGQPGGSPAAGTAGGAARGARRRLRMPPFPATGRIPLPGPGRHGGP